MSDGVVVARPIAQIVEPLRKSNGLQLPVRAEMVLPGRAKCSVKTNHSALERVHGSQTHTLTFEEKDESKQNGTRT